VRPLATHLHIDSSAIVRVEVVFGADFFTREYTAKIVKSMLIHGSPGLESIFRKGWGPKPIHITPLYVAGKDPSSGVKISAIYTKYVVKEEGGAAKPKYLMQRLRPVKISSGERYIFYIGAPQDLVSEILNSLASVDKVPYGGGNIPVDRLSYEVEYVDLERESEDISGTIASGEVDSVKVVFESPAMLKDPLVVARERKKKIFFPLPEAVFSTPIYMILINEGRLKRNIYIKTLRYIKSVLDTPYTALKTINIAWLIYDNTPKPGLIGYLKYYIDRTTLSIAQEKMKKQNIDFIKTLSKSLAMSKIYGIGTGRAAGFGHVLTYLNKLIK